ncbi:DNA alkylation repair protein [Maritimibacter fusiformis]|uniref:DNA alkylation repair protein n=1 Tax=Maritimibacter fusiformis TaxID=2603819 RepID=A0A5D0RL56_9RHOB|nr:DNA alkylation repair protein [Maritimibacter fusiformis]TYB81676.1 DNA alkylation repair protein [Maritimibacter fusiformis]
MTPEAALNALRAEADPTRAAGVAAYMKVERDYLGVPMSVVNDLTKGWRQTLDIGGRVALADALWQTDIHEARIAATKLLTQARIRPDDAVWSLIKSWVPDFDGWAIADHACMAGHRRLMANPTRVDEVEPWTTSPHLWTRRAALVITLPWARLNNPKPGDIAVRERVLGWAAHYVDDREWFIQKAVAWWLRDLSKHDPDRVRAFLGEHGPRMKAFARKEAGKYLK